MKKTLMLLVFMIAASGCSQMSNSSQDDTGARTASLVMPKPESRGKFLVGKPYRVKGKTYKPRVDLRYRAEGIASWYGEGDGFHGKRTANGALYDKMGYTAASPTLQLPSVVRVTNLENNKSVFVVVNDRGPFSKEKRILDVSKKAAQELGFLQQGTARVRVEYSHAQTLALLAHYPKTEREKAVSEYRLAALQQGLSTTAVQ